VARDHGQVHHGAGILRQKAVRLGVCAGQRRWGKLADQSPNRRLGGASRHLRLTVKITLKRGSSLIRRSTFSQSAGLARSGSVTTQKARTFRPDEPGKYCTGYPTPGGTIVACVTVSRLSLRRVLSESVQKTVDRYAKGKGRQSMDRHGESRAFTHGLTRAQGQFAMTLARHVW